MDIELQQRDKTLADLHDRLLHAKLAMKLHYDAAHRDGDWGTSSPPLQPYRQISLASRSNKKLGPRYFGHFKILERLGTNAYKLELRASSKLHPVFHVSSLKRFRGDVQAHLRYPTLIMWISLNFLRQFWTICMRQGRSEVLVHWVGLSLADASWEDAASLATKFPTFVFEVNHDSQGGSDVMDSTAQGKPYINTAKNTGRSSSAVDKVYKRFTHGRHNFRLGFLFHLSTFLFLERSYPGG